MLTTKTICTLLLGAGLGAGGVTVTHKVTDAPKRVSAKVQGKRVAKTAPASGAHRAVPASPSILDCPAPAPSLGPGVWASVPALADPPRLSAEGPPSWPGGGGGILPPSPPTPSPPAVPEPGAWAMLVAGFGLVAVSLRRKRNEQA